MRGRLIIGVVAIGLLVAIGGCGSDSSSSSSSASPTTADTTTAEKPSSAPAKKKTKPKVVPPKGPAPTKLVVKDLETGTGAAAKPGDELTVQYVGVGYKTGLEFDSSWSRNEPFSFTLGEGNLIKGWEEGLQGMKAGGRRELITPPDYAYGSQGSGNIAPNATLVFVIDLLEVK